MNEFILVRPNELKDLVADAVKAGLNEHLGPIKDLSKSLDKDEEWLDHKRAIVFAGVGDSTLRMDRSKGLISGRKLGRKWEYHIDELKAYKERKATKETPSYHQGPQNQSP